MATITATAKQFFDACETGKGWEGCKSYCTADATFSAQAANRMRSSKDVELEGVGRSFGPLLPVGSAGRPGRRSLRRVGEVPPAFHESAAAFLAGLASGSSPSAKLSHSRGIL